MTKLPEKKKVVPERGKNVRKSKGRYNTFLRRNQQKADLFIEDYRTHKNEFWII